MDRQETLKWEIQENIKWKVQETLKMYSSRIPKWAVKETLKCTILSIIYYLKLGV